LHRSDHRAVSTKDEPPLDDELSAVVSMNCEGQIIGWNEHAERVFGWPAHEVVDLHATATIVAMRDRVHLNTALARCLLVGSPTVVGRVVELRARHRDGHEFPAEFAIAMSENESQGPTFVAVVTDISERKLAERRADEARSGAEGANREKSEFLSRMSHELRTPLGAILGFAELLEMGGAAGDPLTAEQEGMVRHILVAGKHLLELINEALDISRIESGHVTLSIEPVHLSELVDDVLGIVAPLAQAKSVSVTTDLSDAQTCDVLADRQRLKQVLLNLTSNAIKYCPEGAAITISANTPDATTMRIEVRDTGPGIPKALRHRLFQPFDRLGAEATGIEGTGLGLSLSRRLAQAMGGELEAVFDVPRGACFRITLRASERQEQQARERQIVGRRTRRPATVSEGRRVVLCIEDNPSNFMLMESILAMRPNVQLLAAIQGRLGVDLAREHRPDAILLDVHLPDVGGDEVVRLLRQDPRTADIPIVVVSADATAAQIRRLRKEGIRDYLTKPLKVSVFLDALDSVLSVTAATPVGGVA
jgi:PAS domain S-box-containing protein